MTNVYLLQVSKHTFTLLTKYNADNRKSMNKLHDNIVGILQYSDNRTTQQMKITEDTNIILKQMKVELKEDFNSYANKVIIVMLKYKDKIVNWAIF